MILMDMRQEEDIELGLLAGVGEQFVDALATLFFIIGFGAAVVDIAEPLIAIFRQRGRVKEALAYCPLDPVIREH